LVSPVDTEHVFKTPGPITLWNETLQPDGWLKEGCTELMNGFKKEKRAEVRLPIAVGAKVTLRDWPLPNPAMTVNLNSNGALLRFAKPIALDLGDVIMCDFDETETDIRNGAPAQWARGEVVRVSANDVALQFLESSFFRGSRKKRTFAA